MTTQQNTLELLTCTYSSFNQPAEATEEHADNSGDIPTQGHSFRTREAVILPNAQNKIQKAKQNEEIVEYVTNERIRQASERELNEMEIPYLSDKELKVIVIKIFTTVERRVDELRT